MPHEFPLEIIDANSSRNPELLNERFRKLAAELSAGLNEHDLAAGLITDKTKIEHEAITSLSVVRVSADPSWLTNYHGGYWAEEDTGNSVDINDTPAWQEIATTTLTSGEDMLYIVANMTYVGGYDNSFPDPLPVRAQFCLEVDGALQQDTITGHLDLTQDVSTETYQVDRTNVPYKTWDHRHIRRLVDVVALGGNAKAIRMVCSIPVLEGSHTVRLLGRRVPRNEIIISATSTIVENREYLLYQNKMSPNDLETYATSELNILRVYSHTLAVFRLGGWQKATTADANTFAPDDLEDGDTLARTKIKAQRIDAAATVLNDLKEGELARGSLRSEHLPSVVKSETAHQITDTTLTTITTEYDGFENTTGDNILQYNWALDKDAEGRVLILADIEVTDLSLAGENRDVLIGVFKLVAETGSGLVVLGGTEAYVSSDVLIPASPLASSVTPRWTDGALDDVNENVSLAWAGELSELPADTLSIRVYACVWDAEFGAGSGMSMEVKRRNLSCITFWR